MLGKLREQPAFGKLIAQYDQMSQRDQLALKVLAVALFLGLLYFALWRPITVFHEHSASARDNAAELLAWMQTNKASIQRLANANGTTTNTVADKPADGRALMALVTRSARESGLTLQRFEPSGSDAIRIWIENAPFSRVAAWLESLKNDHGVVIDQAAMDKSGTPGEVSVRLTLTI